MGCGERGGVVVLRDGGGMGESDVMGMAVGRQAQGREEGGRWEVAELEVMGVVEGQS